MDPSIVVEEQGPFGGSDDPDGFWGQQGSPVVEEEQQPEEQLQSEIAEHAMNNPFSDELQGQEEEPHQPVDDGAYYQHDEVVDHASADQEHQAGGTMEADEQDFIQVDENNNVDDHDQQLVLEEAAANEGQDPEGTGHGADDPTNFAPDNSTELHPSGVQLVENPDSAATGAAAGEGTPVTLTPSRAGKGDIATYQTFSSAGHKGGSYKGGKDHGSYKDHGGKGGKKWGKGGKKDDFKGKKVLMNPGVGPHGHPVGPHGHPPPQTVIIHHPGPPMKGGAPPAPAYQVIGPPPHHLNGPVVQQQPRHAGQKGGQQNGPSAHYEYIQAAPGAPATTSVRYEYHNSSHQTARHHATQKTTHTVTTLTAEQMKDFSLRRPDAYAKFSTHNVRMHNGLFEISLSRCCPEKFFADFLDCLHCWLQKTHGEIGPYHIRLLDVGGNKLSNYAVRLLCEKLKEWQVRVDLLNLSGNCLDRVDDLVSYMWYSERPLLALGLKNNRLKCDEVNAVLRCCYNHENYPAKSEDGRRFVPLRIELEGNPCSAEHGMLPELFSAVHRQGKVHISADDSPTRDLPVHMPLYLAVHCPGSCSWRPPPKLEPRKVARAKRDRGERTERGERSERGER
ncbi:unnamed protein product, partial [Amoebophrya sp. A120]|eukprot:GSA120T00017503001.1